MANYSIKDLENFTGVKAHTIRIWEKRYNVVEPKRTCTNIRYYDDEDLKRLLNISILNRHGYKISNIVNFTEDSMHEKILSLSQSYADVESQVESLVLAMIDMDEARFEKIFNTAVINLGFEDAIIKLMYPFFEKIGLLWQIGSINPAQEHFVSNLLRQKLIVAIDGLVENLNGTTKTFVLFLPEGEYHELGLLFYHYLIKKYNQKVFYLGETVPFEALNDVSKARKVDYFVTSVITARADDELQNYINRLSEEFPSSVIFMSGLQTINIDFEVPGNVKLIENASEFRLFLENIS
ncbi:MAG: MerR family transcriptional regulator [Bacteroidales bacterium]|nr:MerR family transcriptional regulator [Bacteroidales bacterium]